MLSDLLSRFHDTLPALKRGAYNETEVRVQFINPLFAALGWDMAVSYTHLTLPTSDLV